MRECDQKEVKKEFSVSWFLRCSCRLCRPRVRATSILAPSFIVGRLFAWILFLLYSILWLHREVLHPIVLLTLKLLSIFGFHKACCSGDAGLPSCALPGLWATGHILRIFPATAVWVILSILMTRLIWETLWV